MKRKPLLDPNRHFNGKPLGKWDPSKESKLDPKPGTQNPKPGKKDPDPPKDWIRGPLLEVLVEKENGVSMEEAIARAEKEKRVIASNKRLDQALVGSDEWKKIKAGLYCWSGTMTAYEEVEKPFGEVVEYTDGKTGLKYLFEVPQKYRGKTNCILVAEHPDYSLEIKGNERIIRTAKVELIEKFPADNNKWYLTDPKHGIPFGDSIDSSNNDARYLSRINKMVGLSARGYDDIGDYGRDVVLDVQPSTAFGVAVEAPEGGARKK